MAKRLEGGSEELTRRSRNAPLEGGSDALEAILATLNKVNQIDLGKVAEAAEAAKSVQDKFREQLEAGIPTTRAKPKRKKQHHSTRRKYLREYHRNVRKPRNAVAKAELLRRGGWFALLKEGWDKAGVPVEVTAEEWRTVVGDLFDCVRSVARYRTSDPISLGNVIVRDRDTAKVVFDGAEWFMRSRGYIL